VNAALGFPVRVYAGVLDAALQFTLQAWLALLGLALRTGLILWAILTGGGLLTLAWMALFASLPLMALQIWYARRAAPWARWGNSPIQRERVKALFGYSVYTFVSAVADSLRSQIDPVVITCFIGLAAVTHYRIASVFTGYYVNVVLSLAGIVQPIMSQSFGAGDRSRLERVFFFATKVSLCISVFIGIALIFWGKPFILRWMGTSYRDAYLPMAVLTAAVLLDVGQSPSLGLLNATFNQRFYTYVNLAEGIINLIVSLALARPLGILGVALGTLVAAIFVRLAVLPLWVCRAVGLRYWDYVRFVGGNALRCCFVVGIALAFSAWGLRASYPYLIGSAVCAAGIYVAGSWLIVFNECERKQLLAAMTNRYQKRMEPVALIAPL
jgi:O-antigen/teichoic acid export membrane protein